MKRESAEPETPSSERVKRGWFIVSNAAERSSRMMTEDKEATLAGGSVTR